MKKISHRRILVVDDSAELHNDYLKIFSVGNKVQRKALDSLEDDLFGNSDSVATKDSLVDEISYELDSAYQGEEGIQKVIKAREEGAPYGVIFMDIRMPPGIDGVQTSKEILNLTENTQIVLCSAYSDYNWNDIVNTLGVNDRVLFLEKPFRAIEVQQIALSLSEKFKKLNYLDSILEKLKENINKTEMERDAKEELLSILQSSNFPHFLPKSF